MKEIKGKSTLVQVIARVRVIGSQQNVLKEFYKGPIWGKIKHAFNTCTCKTQTAPFYMSTYLMRRQ